MWIYTDLPLDGNQMDNIIICNKHETVFWEAINILNSK